MDKEIVDSLSNVESRIEEIYSTLSDVESALGWLVKRAREEDKAKVGG